MLFRSNDTATTEIYTQRDTLSLHDALPIADGVKPSEYGRREAFRVHQGVKKQGRVRVPREFVFMDRAAIGLGGVFLHLDARLNFYRLFNEAIEKFSLAEVAKRQNATLKKAGLDEVAAA